MLNSLTDALTTHIAGLVDTPMDSRRLFHGRGRCFPGLEQITVDWFDPVILVTLFKAEQGIAEADCLAAIASLPWPRRVSAIVVQRRYLDGAPMAVLWGDLPDEVVARRQGASFGLQLGDRQNTGFFLDMEPGRQWLAERAPGKRVLNLFAYTCAFSVVAQQAGAVSVVNVDMSRAALSQGRDNHRRNQLPLETIRFLGENILKSWSRIRRPGPYDLAIIDPPSFQPGSFVAQKDYAKILRRIPELLVPGGEILVCLNAPELGAEFIEHSMQEACPDAHLIARLQPHPDFPDRDPEQQLKLFHFRYEPG